MLALLAVLQGVAPVPPSPYWQQHIAYEIDARLDEPRGVLSGTERLVYRNNSPDSLRTFSFHLYLNAFRPGSRWSDVDRAEHRRRFNDLKDPDFGFNHVSNVRIFGQRLEPIYPLGPDSTIVRFNLPRPLAPGDSLVAELDWDARPSTVPRRQGRQGRAFDFAQWYPRVVAYDKHGWQEHALVPAGEFYGDFGDFTVKLDVPEDQVVGATGVALCGDPGWERANQNQSRAVDYQRDHYPAALSALPADACRTPAAGRKTIVWRAEDVHHFAMSMRPDYRYEGGKWGNVAVNVLYQPGDEKTWGGGAAVRNTETALRWLDGLFGPFPWPQITNVHRIEGGGTEFPMMIHDGSPSLGLILHELGHNYLMGILANNEWREGYLDEGFTSFQSTWFFESQGGKGMYEGNERQILNFDLDGQSEPTSLQSDKYRDFITYNVMIYSRGELFYHQLREIVGDSVMRQILRTYYQRWKLHHVDEAAFRETAEEVSKRDLSAFFGQWLHTTELYDYAVGKVKSRRRSDRTWETRVEVRRKSPGIFPVDVVVRSKTDSAMIRVDGLAEREWVTLTTRERPREVLIDPRVRSHDWDMTNNRATRNWMGWDVSPKDELYLDPVFSKRARRDRTTTGLLPEVWYNDEGGVTVGLRATQNYLGRFNQVILEPSFATRNCCSSGRRSLQGYASLQNPTWLRVPRGTLRFEAFDLEGRQGAGVFLEQQRLGHLGFGPTSHFGASVGWVATNDMRYLDVTQYENAGTVEGQAWYRSAEQRGSWQVAGKVTLGGGVEYREGDRGIVTSKRYDTQPYFRGSAEATAKRAFGTRYHVGFRVFGGLVRADLDPVRQRWFYPAGADPYEQLRHPGTRSAGSLLTDDFHFQHPGGGNLRGYDPALGVTGIAAATAELEGSVLRRNRAKLFRDVRLALFGDAGYTDGFFTLRQENHFMVDGGVGLRIWHHLGQTEFVTRLDLPLYVLQPDRAVGFESGSLKPVRFRWVVAVKPAF